MNRDSIKSKIQPAINSNEYMVVWIDSTVGIKGRIIKENTHPYPYSQGLFSTASNGLNEIEAVPFPSSSPSTQISFLLVFFAENELVTRTLSY